MSSIPSSADPSWQNSGLSSSELNQIASALGYSSIDDPAMPALSNLSDAQLVTIGLTVDPAVATKLSSAMSDISNPTLDEPDETFDARELMLVLASLNKELGEMGVAFNKEGINIDKDKLKSKSDKRLKTLQKAIKKMTKAKKSGQASKILGWAGVAVGILVAAVVLTVVVVGTGGLGAAAIAPAIGLGIALLSGVVMGLQESGEMDKILNELLAGKSDESKEKWKMGIQIGIMAFLMIAGIASGAGAASSVKMLADAGKITTMATTIMVASQISGALVGLGAGTAGAVNAFDQKEVAETSAESKEFQAWIAKLQTAIDQQTEELQALMEKLSSMAFDMPAKIMDSVQQTIQSITSQQMSSQSV